MVEKYLSFSISLLIIYLSSYLSMYLSLNQNFWNISNKWVWDILTIWLQIWAILGERIYFISVTWILQLGMILAEPFFYLTLKFLNTHLVASYPPEMQPHWNIGVQFIKLYFYPSWYIKKSSFFCVCRVGRNIYPRLYCEETIYPGLVSTD